MSSVVQMRLRAQSTSTQIRERHRQEGALHCAENDRLAAEHHRQRIDRRELVVAVGI
jgi:hypothetical protein